ncbi:hypothetical protein [Myxococcus sp. RHSTA-1-4]|uniref:hypothetical protein n=1 Tax=Myxococcus sp. RHSTA-1-4 TaxID=2874601 RepID=UPI001CBCBCD7|nr:hypothetical protein [Myxococcus sp. RHSTA-1-4]MBZ4420171.1 hypothetical protein [Myxococcus sp. RHSTA-1-4]
MSSESILRHIEEIQARFPAEVTERMRLERVGAEHLDEMLARASTVFPPVFLPIFERDANLYAVHLVPGRPWRASAWVELPHDAAAPVLVATAVQYLPAALVVPPQAFPNFVAEIWPQVQALAEALAGAVSPDLEPFLQPRAKRARLLSGVDPGNGAARSAVELGACGSWEEAAERAEQVWREAPEDTYRLFAVAMARAKRKQGDATGPAREVLSREVAWGFMHAVKWLIPPSDSGPEVLEALRPLALAGLEDEHPLALLRESSYRQGETAERLREVAEAWRARGDERQALNQLRNGAAVAGAHGSGLTRVWCERLAEQAERVEPGGLSAQLARHAGEVFHLGA